MLKTVRLGGAIGKKYGRTHKLDCADARDALRALCALIPGFQQDFIRLKYRVVLDGTPMTNREELGLPAREIRFAPVIGGAGRGVGEVILGIVLIAAAFYTDGASLALETGVGTAAGWGAALSMAASLGAAMVLNGLSSALAQNPQQTSSNSYLFSGPVNSTHQGNPVPILYGTLMIGSQVASANLQAYDIAIGPPTTNTGTSTSIASNGTITTTNQSVSKGAQS